MWCAPAEAPLSDEEEEALERLRGRALVVFDAQNDEHAALLRTLWARACPEQALPAARGAHWDVLGWQGHDPATDLRAAGHLSASCLVFFAEAHADDFRRLLRKEDGTRASFEYPFATAGANLAAALIDALGVCALLPKRAKTPLLPNRAFAALLARQPHAFEELFCAAFVRLDKQWLLERAGYMQFNAVLASVIAAVLAVLAKDLDAIGDVCDAVKSC
jgi:hypothetical protein